LRRDAPEITGELTDIDNIVAFRYVLAHGHDRIKDATVAAIVTDKLPLLQREATALLDRFGRQGESRA